MSRALVLGGGGPVGVGWESGLIVGLAEAGVDLGAADLVVGTSAGSIVGAELTLGWDLEAALAVLDAPWPAAEVPAGSPAGIELLMTELARAASSTGSPEAVRRELGRISLEAPTVPAAAYLGLFSAVHDQAWPERYRCAAVDVETGELRVWERAAGVPLDLAVASSCAVPGIFPPVEIDGRRYMDGGMKTALNADLAVGHDVVVAVSCFALEPPEGFSDPLADMLSAAVRAELDEVASQGRCEVVAPSAEFLELSGWGLKLMDQGIARDAFAVGRRQAAIEAERIGAAWNA
jgi:NTE family protein